MKVQNILRIAHLIVILLLVHPIIAENRIDLTPESGAVIEGPACTLSVESFIPADSVVFSIEYRSLTGLVKKKNIGTVTNPPFSIILDTRPMGNQYFFGANAVAKVYRRDDTLQIVNSPQLFLLPDTIFRETFPLYPTSYSRSTAIELSDSTTASVSVKKEHAGVEISFTTHLSKLKKDDGVTIILDPLLTRSPFPGNETIVIFVPFDGEPQLITTSETGKNSTFSISRTGTTIALNKKLKRNENVIDGVITVPDFLLGGTVKDSIGINVILPHRTQESEMTISLIEGEEPQFYSPILFPTFVKTIPPVETKSPWPIFWRAFLGGFFVMAIIFVAKKTPLTPIEAKPEESELLTAIEDFITNPHLSADMLSAQLKMTPARLNRECRKVTGKNLAAYISWLRIEIVKERLVSSNASEIAIAQECGFSSLAEMEDRFHDYTGIAPYQFRQRNGMN